MMGSRPPPTLKTEQFDMDSFFDFTHSTTQPSPLTATSASTDLLSPLDKEERQHFNGPSHDYGQFKQQVGLPVGSMANMPLTSHSGDMFDGFNSGIGDMDFNSGFGWNSGLDMDADMGVDFTPQSSVPAMFFAPASNDSPVDNFVNPNNVGGHEEPASNVGRLWPGMHSQQAQQAAMQKAAQAQAIQQRQLKLQAQQAQYRQASVSSQSQGQAQGQVQGHQASSKRASHVPEPHVEESISRLLNQMRQNSTVSDDDNSPSSGLHAHIARMKKDDEEMDEDERLLASEEGKKLSSKERRQLRNKVSARAFRSRRKEYIGQLEGEVALKTQESNNLRNENQVLMRENERYRGLIETLLRHPAFTPFISDISKDPSLLNIAAPQAQQQAQQQQPQQQKQKQRPSATPQPQHQTPSQPSQQAPQQQQQQQQQQQSQEQMKPDFLNFDASQLTIPQPPQQVEQAQQVGLAMVPENDFSKLNLNGFNAMNFNNYSVNAYAVVDVPKGPDPVELLAKSPIYSRRRLASPATCASEGGLNVLLAKLYHAATQLGGAVV